MLDKIKKALNPKGDDKKEEGKVEGAGGASVPSVPGTVPPVQPGGTQAPAPASTTPAPSSSGGVPPTGPMKTQTGATTPSSPASTGGSLSKPVTPPAISPQEEKTLGALGKKVLGPAPGASGMTVDQAAKAKATPPEVPTAAPTGSAPARTVSSPAGSSMTSTPKPPTAGSVPPQPAVTTGQKSGGAVTNVPPIGKTATPSVGTTPQAQAGSSPGARPASGQVPASPGGTTPSGGTASGSAPDEELKKTHEPVLDLPDRLEMGQTVNVKVKVGMLPHVMEEAHHIQSIELFVNDTSVGKVQLNPKDNKTAEADFQVSLTRGMKIKAIVYCNVHGKWEVEQTI